MLDFGLDYWTIEKHLTKLSDLRVLDHLMERWCNPPPPPTPGIIGINDSGMMVKYYGWQSFKVCATLNRPAQKSEILT